MDARNKPTECRYWSHWQSDTSALRRGYVLVMARIHRADFETAFFEKLEERNPVDARGLRCNGSDAALLQPVRQSMQIFGKGRIRPNRLGIAVGGNGNENLARPDIHACGVRLHYGWDSSLCRFFASFPSCHAEITSGLEWLRVKAQVVQTGILLNGIVAFPTHGKANVITGVSTGTWDHACYRALQKLH
jgi:hypothetical protein